MDTTDSILEHPTQPSRNAEPEALSARAPLPAPIAPWANAEEMADESERLMELHARLPREITDFIHDSIVQCRALESKLAKAAPKFHEAQSMNDVMAMMKAGAL